MTNGKDTGCRGKTVLRVVFSVLGSQFLVNWEGGIDDPPSPFGYGRTS